MFQFYFLKKSEIFLFHLSKNSNLSIKTFLYRLKEMEGLQAPVEPGGVRRGGDDVRAVAEHLVAGHRLVQQVRQQ